jgi:beta-lactamase class D
MTAIGSCFVTGHQVYAQTEAKIEQEVDFQQHFQSLDVNGSIIIYDLNQNTFYQHNRERNNTAFLPASTYKIPNSLIALETGVIRSDVDVLTWDGIERDLPQWNQDLNLRQAFKYSAVWFYQVLARRIGHQRMRDFVSKIEYGNQNIGAKEDIDKFWLEGKLRITPRQQIDFLRRLQQNDLPFAQKNIDIVKDIAIAEQTPSYILRAKTGWATATTPQVGWYVGYLEQNDNVYFFATNLEIAESEDLAARLEVTRLCLLDLGLL